MEWASSTRLRTRSSTRTVALKLLPPHALASEDERARFYRDYYTAGWWGDQSVLKQVSGDLGTEEKVISRARAPSVSLDGEWLLFSALEEDAGADVHALNLTSGDTVYVETGSDVAGFPVMSPDRRFVVYSTPQAGGSELRIEPFRGGSPRTVATGTDGRAFWAVDGSALFYVKSGYAVRLLVDTSGEFRVRGPEARLTDDGLVRDVTVDPRSGRLLLLTSVELERKEYATLEWWQGWASELGRRADR